ncbi:MAG: flagellar motor protein MotA, partial [Pseudomonadota bacterium]
SLIAAMATVLMDADQRGRLTAVSNRAILDSIGTRMDETREMNRYLIGLLIFLGLLGTFWGLLGTVNGVAQTISTLNSTAGGSEAQAVTQLIAGLEGPLAGMGTAFSSSLFGLAGSLVLGFLDLQAGQAQNRFYNDLEEWLSTMTTYASPVSGETGGAAYSEALLERTAESLQRLADEAPRERAQLISELKDELRTLTRTISRLTDDRE